MTPKARRNPRILVCDDHPLVRAGLVGALRGALPDTEILEADGIDAAEHALAHAAPSIDLTLLDLNLPGVVGFAGMLLLLERFPDTAVAIISAQETSATIRKAVRLGASGFVPKSASLATIAEAIERMLDGEIWIPQGLEPGDDDETQRNAEHGLLLLTPQELRILSMLHQGKLNKQIAYALGVAEQTIKAHVSTILKKLGVANRTQAALLLEREGGFTSPSE